MTNLHDKKFDPYRLTLDRLETAITKAILADPFLGAILGRLEKKFYVEDDVDCPIDSAAVDGKTLYIYLPFFVDMPIADMVFIMLHEAAHVALMHNWRRGNRPPDQWNVACDAVINCNLIDVAARLPAHMRGVFTMPECGVNEMWVTTAMSAEEVFNRLMAQNQDNDDASAGMCLTMPGEGSSDGDADNDGSGGGEQRSMAGNDMAGAEDESSPSNSGSSNESSDEGDNGTDSTGESGEGDVPPKQKPRSPRSFKQDVIDAPNDANETAIAATLVAAAQMAQMAGRGSAMTDRIIAGANQAIVPWRNELRTFFQSAFSRDDYTYRRPNKRFIAQELYLPSLYSESLGRLIVAVDTSASINNYVLSQVAAEITILMEECRPELLEVVYCDYKVTNVDRFQPGDTVKLNAKGGGGTRFLPVFDWIESNFEGGPIAALIYLTDTYGNMDELVEPSYPVLWGLVERVDGFVPPFGRTVEVYK